ncbi:MAG: RpiR family transcriptional regulator [Clostridia bacterium BRH_c25]|nr:MAG: RpiR family transcriptional regulator [Clostridia bacterium BRH_c25]
MSCDLKIREIYEELTPAEKKLASYVLENGDQVVSLAASDFAELCDTSPASVIRFVKKLGFEGLQDFKIDIAKGMALKLNNQENVYEAVTVHDSTRDIINKISRGNIKAIEDTVGVLNEESVSEAIKALIEANHINIYGVGASGLVAQDLQYKLMRISKSVSMYMDSHTQLTSSIHMKEGDVAIGISHSGRTLEVYKSLERSKLRGAKTISITKYGNSPISEVADIKLYTASVEKHLRTGAIASRIAQLTVADIIFIGVARNNYSEIARFIQDTRDMVEDLKI